MKNIQNELKATRMTRFFAGLAVVVMIIATTVTFAVIKRSSDEYAEDIIKKDIQGMNMRTSVAVQERIVAKKDILELIAENMIRQGLNTVEELQDYLNTFVERYGFYRMGIVLPDGTCFTSDGHTQYLQEVDGYKRVFRGEFMITEAKPSEIEREYVNLFLVPVIYDGEVVCALAAIYLSEDLAAMLNIGVIFEDARSIVLNSEGCSIVELSNYGDREYQKLVETISEDRLIIPNEEVCEANYVSFSYDGMEYLGYMSKIGINDWYLLSFFRKETAIGLTSGILDFISYVVSGLLVLLLVIFLFFVRMLESYQKRINTIVFEDSLLKKKNYRYLEYLAQKWDNYANCMLVAMDVDRFNMLNIAYGSNVGDKVLRYIDQTFHEELPEAILYRKHSDHFVAVLDVASKAEAEKMISTFMNRMNKNITEGSIVAFSASFGLCRMRDCSDLHSAYNNAIIAKRLVKHDSAKKYAFFSEEMWEHQVRNLKMEADFEKALKNHEFQVYYQPKYDMRTKEVVGAEALVRWVKDDHTMISPAEFIPCFEESGKILFLDEEMVEMVCQQMSEMQQQGYALKRVSINLSRTHLRIPHYIINKIRETIRRYEVDPSKLAFEMTESIQYEDSFAVSQIVCALHEMGCQVDMDDYGTGVSGLKALVSTDFDTIKLDRSFIAQRNNKKAEVVIKSTIHMLSAMGMEFIVEGVESQEQVDFLLENNCYYAQGYFFSKPVPREEYEKLLQA